MTSNASENSYYHIWRLSWPIILSNLSFPLAGAVDVAMMGHLPDPAYVGGVGLGSLVFNVLYLAFAFLRMSTTGFTARAKGERNQTELVHILYRSTGIALCSGLFLILLKHPIILTAQHLLNGSALTETLMAEYMSIRIYDVPATLFNIVILGWLFGQQRMKLCMVHLVSVNFLNVGLNILFVNGLGMDVDGVALSTVLAQYAGSAFFITLLFFQRKKIFVSARLDTNLLFDRQKWKDIFSIARDLSVRTLMIWAVEALLLSEAAEIGDLSLATIQIILTLFNFIAFGLDGIAHAAEALVGNKIGAKDKKGLQHIITKSILLSGLLACSTSLLLFIGEWPILNLLTGQAELLEQGHRYWWAVMLIPVASFLAFILDGICVGASEGRRMRDTTLISACICFVIVFSISPVNLTALLTGFLVYLIARGLLLLFAIPPILQAPEKF